MDQNGNHVRSTLYNNGAFTTSVDFQDVKNISSGGYIITGDANSQCLLAKVPAAFGAPTWQYRYVPVSGASAYGSKVIQTSDGGFLVAGSANHVNNGVAMTDSSKMFALKVDASGAVLWSKVFFYSTAFDDDDFLNGVTEVSDGYVFVGSVTTSFNGSSRGSVIKTDVSGNVQWARQIGADDIESVITDAGTNIVMCGLDGVGGFLYNWSAPNSGPTVIGTNTKYTAAGLGVSVGNLTKTFDNNFAVFVSGASLNFTTIIVKANRSTGAVMFAKSYNSFISILPTGIQAIDSGFLMNSLSADTAGGGGYDFAITKADINGNQGGSGCPATNPPVVTQSYSPSVNTFTATAVGTPVRSSGGITGVNSTPSTVINCRTIACNPPPNPTVTSSGNNICPSTPVTISASGGSNVTYHVYTQATGGTSIGNAPLSVSPSATTTYYVEADDNSNVGCLSARGSVTVTVIQPPTAITAISGLTSPCVGSQNYSLTGGTGATSYAWSISGGGSITAGQTSTTATINWTTAGTYNVSVSATNSCGTVSNTISVTVLGNVSGIGASASSTTVCSGANVPLTGSGTNVTTWSWTGPNGFTSAAQSPTVSNIQTNLAGTYTLTASNSCNSGTASVTITVNQTPATPIVAASPNPICSGNSLTLTATGVGGATFNWTYPDGGGPSTTSTTVTRNLVTVAMAGTYTVSQTIAGCPSAGSASVTVTVNPTPVITSAIASNPTICGGSNGTITLSGLTPSATYTVAYNRNGAAQTPVSLTANGSGQIIITGLNAGSYTNFVVTISNCPSATFAGPVVLSDPSAPAAPTVGSNSPVCAGNAINLTVTGTGGASFSWTGQGGFTSSVANPTLPNSTTAMAGSYCATQTVAGCTSVQACVTVTVNTVPQNVSAAANPNPACAGNTVNLTGGGTGAVSWAWSGPNSFSASTQNASVVNAQTNATGTYTITAANTCGNTTATVTATVNDIPLSVTATANPTAVCPGTVLNLSGSASGAASYAWTGPNTFTSTQLNNTISNFQAINEGTYTLNATNACGSASANVTVLLINLIANLTATASSNGVVCSATTVNLSATGNNINSYAWSGPDGFTSTQQNPSISNATVAATGTYTVTASNDCGIVTATVAVEVDTLIENVNSNASPNDTLCAGGTINLNASGTNVTSWTWTGPSNFTAATQTASVPNAQANASGTYTVNASNACGNASSSVTILVNDPIQNLSASASSNGIVCSGTVVNLSAAGTNVNVYTWSGPNNFSSGSQNPSLDPATTTNNGTYTVSASNACGNVSATVSVEVDTLIQNLGVAAAPDDTVCAGVTIQINASGTNVTSWNWSGPGGFAFGQQNLSISNVQPANSGIYTVTGSNACGTATASVNVLVNTSIQNLTASASSNGVICSGSSITLSASAIDVNSWAWTGPNGFTSSQQNPTVNPASSINNGTYTVTARNACGTQTATVAVEVDTAIQNLSVTALPADTICEGGTINLSAAGLNVTSWTWTGPNAFTSTQQSPSITEVTTINSGTYTLTASNACGSSSSSVQVVVSTIPVAPGSINGPVTNCGNSTGTYSVSNIANATSYTWSVSGGGSIISGQGTTSIDVGWGSTGGNFTVSVSAVNNCGGSSATTLSVNIAIPTILGIDVASDTICYNNFTTLTADVAPSGSTVTWWDNAVQGTQLATGAVCGTDFLTQTTTFYAEATSSTGCANLQGRVPVTVVVTPLPVVTITSDKDDNTIFPNEMLTFTAQPDSFANYAWYWNGTLAHNGPENTFASNKFNDLDSVWVIVTAKNGCESLRAEDTVHVVDFPNAFTPNTDGTNDVFLKGYDLVILNRWGQELFKGKDGWDGRYKGDKVSPGTYYYIVTLQRITDRKNEIKGTVLLIED